MSKFKEDAARRLKEYEETLEVESALRQLRAKDLAASDTDVDKYYADHREEYDHPLELSASHILLSSQAEAEAAMGRLKSGRIF